MAKIDVSRREIRRIAEARLHLRKSDLTAQRNEELNKLPEPKPDKKLLGMVTAYNAAKEALDKQAKEAQAYAQKLGLNFNYDRISLDYLNTYYDSDARKAVYAKYEKETAALDRAWQHFDESLALAFSPTEFKEAFERLLRSL